MGNQNALEIKLVKKSRKKAAASPQLRRQGVFEDLSEMLLRPARVIFPAIYQNPPEERPPGGFRTLTLVLRSSSRMVGEAKKLHYVKLVKHKSKHGKFSCYKLGTLLPNSYF